MMLELLAFAAGGRQSSRGRRANVPLQLWNDAGTGGIDPRTRRYLASSGLAPILCFAGAESLGQLPAAQRDELFGAELTAQVRHGALVQTASEVVQVCCDRHVSVTLLKGISISDQHYPAGHLRPMGDVDVLVSHRDRERVQSALLDLGYLPHQGDWAAAAHDAPLCNPENGVWVEVHDSLFPADSILMADSLFTSESIARLSVPSEFQGLPVKRLRDELQLVYLAAYWVRDLSMNAVHPSFLVPVLDAVLLLRNAGERLDWEGMLHWLDNEHAAASLTIMLSWLARHELAGPASSVIPRLASRQGLVGAVELRLLHAVLDRWLLGGTSPWIRRRAGLLWEPLLSSRPLAAKLASLSWRIAFPEDVPDRYSLGYLSRMTRLLAGAKRHTD